MKESGRLYCPECRKEVYPGSELCGNCGYTVEDKPLTKHEAIQVILDDVVHHRTSLNWAIQYCRAAMLMTGDMLDDQINYILYNITGWRHPRAKEVREALRRK